jgi:hypothetical protein
MISSRRPILLDLVAVLKRPPEAAHAALATLAQSWKYHPVATSRLSEHKPGCGDSAHRGRCNPRRAPAPRRCPP